MTQILIDLVTPKVELSSSFSGAYPSDHLAMFNSMAWAPALKWTNNSFFCTKLVKFINQFQILSKENDNKKNKPQTPGINFI